MRTKGLIVAALAAALAVQPAALAPAVAAAARTQYPTIWYGLRFVQDGVEAPYVVRDPHTLEIRLRRAPFRLLLSRRGRDDVYRITAWIDDTIFRGAPIGIPAREEEGDRGFNYFSDGSGFADTVAGSGILFVENHGHNNLSGLRLGPDPAHHEVAYASTFKNGDETPLTRIDGPLYLVAYYDLNHNDVMEDGEYVFLVLRFDA